jgi:hypothetical protein
MLFKKTEGIVRTFIDGKEVTLDASRFGSTREYFAYCKEGFSSGMNMIFKIEVDGKAVSIEDFYSCSLGGVQEVRLYSKPREQLMKDALREIFVSLPGLAKDVSEIIHNLRDGKDKEAIEDYVRIMPLINTVLLGIRSVEVGSNDDFKLDYPTLIDCLKKMGQAHESKDYVLLADSLEYFLLPWLKSAADAIVHKAK